MKSQKFLEEDWDYAIILDSARFDIFSEVYSDYFEGELEKRESPASTSEEWLDKVLKDEYDIAWFSANFFVNSIDKPIDTLRHAEYSVIPDRHIRKIFDLWGSEWGKQGTVPPEKIYQKFREEKESLESDRVVFHYIKPHLPVVGRGKSFLYKRMREDYIRLKNNEFETGLLSKLLSKPLKKADEFTLVQKFNFASHLYLRDFLRFYLKDSREIAKEVHRENLRNVLSEVEKLLQGLNGRVVITSDHGEAFGEEGIWGHKAEKDIAELREVPWLESEEVK
jgi:hypothetical protein